MATNNFSSTDIKTRVSSLSPDELEALQNIYHDRWRKNWLRTMGWINIFFGLFTLWLGLAFLPVLPFPKLIQALAGALIVGQSFWMLVSPTNSAILRFAALLFGTGIWNIFVAIEGNFSGGLTFLGLLGAAQLWWAFQTYQEYQRFQQMSLHQPQADIMQFYDDLWHAMTKGTLRRNSETFPLWIALEVWEVLFLEDKAVFALRRQKLLVIQHKDEVNFIPNSSKPMKKWQVYGRIKLNMNFERAMMRGSAFAKYSQWKGEEAVLAEVTPSFWERLPTVVRIVLMIIGGLILLYVGWMVVSIIGLIIEYS